jgi:hypothetical protein
MASEVASQDLRARMAEAPIPMKELASLLDGLSHEERVAWVRSLGRRDQRRLYEAAEGFLPLGLADLVPPRCPDAATVRHFGKNTLPAFTWFEKRFARPAGQDPRAPTELHGFNFQALRWLTGPGYYVARTDPERPEVLIDYREIPPVAPPGWPPLRDNEGGLGRLVYGNMVDRLRRVSEHVTIGSAAKNGRDLGSWFLLTREA